MRFTRFLFGKKIDSSAERRMLFFTTVGGSPDDLPETPGDPFKPSGSDELTKSLKRLKTENTTAGKEIEMILRAWLSKAEGTSSESIGFHQSADGRRTNVTRLSYVNNKIIAALQGIGVPEAKISQYRNALPISNDEMVTLMVDQAEFISRESYDTMMAQRSERTSNPGPKDRRRMEALRRNIARYESGSRRGGFRSRATNSRRARNARHQLRLFESGKKSYDPVHGQARSRYVSGRGKFWETYSSNTGKWSRSTEVEPVDFAAIRARLAIRDKSSEKVYGTNSLTGETYNKRQWENLQILRGWRRDPVQDARRRSARRVSHMMGGEANGFGYDRVKGIIFDPARRKFNADFNAKYGTHRLPDQRWTAADVGATRQMLMAKARGADVDFNRGTIDHIAPERRRIQENQAKNAATRRAELEIKTAISQYAKDIGVPAGTKVAIRGGNVYIGNKQQLQLSTNYEFVDGKPVYTFTIINRSLISKVSVEEHEDKKTGKKTRSLSKEGSSASYSTYEEAKKAGRDIVTSDAYAEVEGGGETTLSEEVITEGDTEEIEQLTKQETLANSIRQKAALVQSALDAKGNMESATARPWMSFNLESRKVIVHMPGEINDYTILLDEDGENVIGIYQGADSLLDDEDENPYNAFKEKPLNEARATELVSMWADCSRVTALDKLLKTPSLGDYKLEKDGNMSWLGRADLVNASGDTTYELHVGETNIVITDINDNDNKSVEFAGKTTEQVFAELSSEVSNLPKIELADDAISKERMNKALEEKLKAGSTIAGLPIGKTSDDYTLGEKNGKVNPPYYLIVDKSYIALVDHETYDSELTIPYEGKTIDDVFTEIENALSKKPEPQEAGDGINIESASKDDVVTALGNMDGDNIGKFTLSEYSTDGTSFNLKNEGGNYSVSIKDGIAITPPKGEQIFIPFRGNTVTDVIDKFINTVKKLSAPAPETTEVTTHDIGEKVRVGLENSLKEYGCTVEMKRLDPFDDSDQIITVKSKKGDTTVRVSQSGFIENIIYEKESNAIQVKRKTSLDDVSNALITEVADHVIEKLQLEKKGDETSIPAVPPDPFNPPADKPLSDDELAKLIDNNPDEPADKAKAPNTDNAPEPTVVPNAPDPLDPDAALASIPPPPEALEIARNAKLQGDILVALKAKDTFEDLNVSDNGDDKTFDLNRGTFKVGSITVGQEKVTVSFTTGFSREVAYAAGMKAENIVSLIEGIVDASEKNNSKNSLAETVSKELEIKGASGYSAKIEQDGDAFLVNFTHNKYGTYTIEIAEDGKTIKGFRKVEKVKDDSYDPSRFKGEDSFTLRNEENAALSEPARSIITHWLPAPSPILDQYIQQEELKDQLAEEKKVEQRGVRHDSMEKMISSQISSDFVVSASFVDSHDRYTLTKGDQVITVDTQVDDNMKIDNVAVGGKDITMATGSVELFDIAKVVAEVQLQTGKNAPPEPNLFSGKAPDEVPVSTTDNLEDLLSIDSNTGERLPTANEKPQEQIAGKPVPLFPDEMPPPAPLSDKEAQATLNDLLSPDKDKSDGPDEVELAGTDGE